MKVQSFGKKNTKRNAGIATLEILIAFAILILCISAVIMISFGNQSVSIDSETNNEALYKAHKILEDARSNSRQNYSSINSLSTTETVGGLTYTKLLTVADVTQCKKLATSTVSWTMAPARIQKIELTTFFSDIAGALARGGDCDAEVPLGGWTIPQTLLSRDLIYKSAYGDNPSVNSSAGVQATDIDVLNKLIYMTAATFNKDNFFILNGANILTNVMPPILGSLNTGPGLNALDVAKNMTNGKIHAYIANSDVTKPFQVIDATIPGTPAVVASLTLPGLTTGYGRSILYYGSKVYIGTQYLPCVGCPPNKNNELHIYDVTNPASPLWEASIKVNRNVNAIAIANNLLYVATGPGSAAPYTPLKIFDVNPSSATYLQQIGSFTAPGAEQGTSLYILGNKLYLGLEHTPSSRPDFYILDIQTPSASPLPIVGSLNLNLHNGTSVTGIRVIGKYLFIGDSDSNSGFLVYDVSNPSIISLISTFNYSNDTTGIDYENGFIYASNNQNDSLRIIQPAQCVDKIDNDGDGKIDTSDPQCHSDGNVNNASSYNPEDNNES